MKYSWIEFITYVFNFFFSRKKINREKRDKEQERINDSLQEDYEAIDKKKDKNKGKDVKKRLDNMF